MALGAILRAERERRGLTEHQVADATHMMVQMVRELEEEDFHRIAASIYGRGFVKLYASHLELDWAPLVKEFEQLYSERGRRPVAPRVPLQRFGDTPGAALERVAPPNEMTRPDAPPPARVVPQPVRVVPTPAPVAPPPPPPPPPADLFGEPLADAEVDDAPTDEDEPHLSIPRPAGPTTPMAALNRVPSPSPERPAVTGVGPGHRITPAATSASTPGARHSVLDSASHRFDGQPYRPGVGRLVGGWLWRLVAVVGLGFGAVVAAVMGVLRGVGRTARRGGQSIGHLPWMRIGRVVLIVVPVLLLLWGVVAGVRSCARAPAVPTKAPTDVASSAILERILPPPPGYAD